MPIDESLIVETDNTYDDAYESWNVLGKLADHPTAVMTSSDEVAVGIMNGVRDEGLSIPDDVEIICFQHSILARIVRPQLSAIVVPLYDLGAVSMRLLTKLINEEEVEETEVILPYHLEERQSVK